MAKSSSSTYREMAALLIALLLPALAQAVDHSWYQSATSFCYDPYALENTYMNGSWFHRYLDLHFVHPSQEVGYVELNKQEYEEILAKGAQGGVFEQHELSPQDARDLKSKLLTDSTNSVVPVTAKLIPLLLGYISKPASVVSGGLMKYMLAADGVLKANARDLAQVVAEGGRLERVLTISLVKPSHSYLVHTFDYAVDVAKEHRHYATNSCSYAIKIIYREFHTEAAQNNKIFRRANATTWNRIDVDTNRIEQTLIETGRDDDFIYLNENVPGNLINDAYRISLNGGPWQILQSRNWLTLCSKVTAE